MDNAKSVRLGTKDGLELILEISDKKSAKSET